MIQYDVTAAVITVLHFILAYVHGLCQRNRTVFMISLQLIRSRSSNGKMWWEPTDGIQVYFWFPTHVHREVYNSNTHINVESCISRAHLSVLLTSWLVCSSRASSSSCLGRRKGLMEDTPGDTFAFSLRAPPAASFILFGYHAPKLICWSRPDSWGGWISEMRWKQWKLLAWPQSVRCFIHYQADTGRLSPGLGLL